MAKTSGGVRSKVLGLTAGGRTVSLQNLYVSSDNHNEGTVWRETGGRYVGMVSSRAKFSSKVPEIFKTRTEKALLKEMRKRGFIVVPGQR